MDHPLVIVIIAAAVVLVMGLELVVVSWVRSGRGGRRYAVSSARSTTGRPPRSAHGDGERELRLRLQKRRELESASSTPSSGTATPRRGSPRRRASWSTRRPGCDADLLVRQVMRDRGYPVERFEERAGRPKMVTTDVGPGRVEVRATATAASIRYRCAPSSAAPHCGSFRRYARPPRGPRTRRARSSRPRGWSPGPSWSTGPAAHPAIAQRRHRRP